MLQFIEFMSTAAVVIVFNQLYAYAVSLKGQEKQDTCQKFGITYLTIGIFSLASRVTPVIIGGLIMIMMGLRLIAHGLDRINKSTYIDRYNPDK